MRRADFLRRLLGGAAAVAAAPLVLEAPERLTPEPELSAFQKELNYQRSAALFETRIGNYSQRKTFTISRDLREFWSNG